MLKVENIHKTFNVGTVNEKHALNGVSLTLNDGDFVTVIGSNGAGKSTLLNAIAGIWPIDEGKIFWMSVDKPMRRAFPVSGENPFTNMLTFG